MKDVYPNRMPDVFAGKPLVLTGRYESHPGLGGEPIQISGRTGKGKIQMPIPTFRGLTQDSSDALPSVWARMKIADLLERSQYDPSFHTMREVRQTALDFQLLSPYTAFVAMDASRRTKGERDTTAPVAVPVPEGVKYQTTVDE